MRAVAPELYADLIGKPFEPGGRGPHTYDCVGLGAELQRRLGQSLPAYLSAPEELHRQLAAGGILAEANRLPGPIAGCIVLLRGTEMEDRHLAIMLDAYEMIHASEPAKQVVKQVLARTFWARRVLGFYDAEGAL